jgi:hypothetical protein
VWAIAEAKKRWAEEKAEAPGSIPEERDLLPYFRDLLPDWKGDKFPICYGGGRYYIGPIGSNPSCSLTNEHPYVPLVDLPAPIPRKKEKKAAML